jgi:hypothetical protein
LSISPGAREGRERRWEGDGNLDAPTLELRRLHMLLHGLRRDRCARMPQEGELRILHQFRGRGLGFGVWGLESRV